MTCLLPEGLLANPPLQDDRSWCAIVVRDRGFRAIGRSGISGVRAIGRAGDRGFRACDRAPRSIGRSGDRGFRACDRAPRSGGRSGAGDRAIETDYLSHFIGR
ncbi:hypothetical protein QUA82_28940 [Microcoleus sp. F8-D3]